MVVRVSLQLKQEIEVGNAGTVARFLTAWLAIQENSNYLFDGSDEMRERPIGQLLEFFQSGGVDSKLQEEDGFFSIPIQKSFFHMNGP